MRTLNAVRFMLLICLTCTGGCGGYYILTVPDHIAPAGAEGVVAARLQRNDFFVLSMPVDDAPLRFRIDLKDMRAGYTDKTGYAGSVIRAPSEPGTYHLTVAHQDFEGEEVEGAATMYVMSPDRDIIVVDLDCLPRGGSRHVVDAVRAISEAARKANVLYLSRRSVSRYQRAHQDLQALGYPEGPILPWRRTRWHIIRSGRFNLPRVVFESRLESQLSVLRGMFDGLNVGVCTSSSAARAFSEAGMRTVFVGKGRAKVANLTRRISWSEFAIAGL